MLNTTDLYTWAEQVPLEQNNQLYGTAFQTYQVTQLLDVRNLTLVQAYYVTCGLRIVIPNEAPFVVGPSPEQAFKGYPAMFTSKLSLVGGEDFDIRLVDYSPRTLNASISTSSTQNASDGLTDSHEHTAGSSLAETNTFGASVSAGLMGDIPMIAGDISDSFGLTHERSTSDTTGSATTRNTDSGTSASMSVKDWASYASVDPATNSAPEWVWCQEYPWDVLQYRCQPTKESIVLPSFVLPRLFDIEQQDQPPKQAYPPSQLSLFGLDFKMTATWLINLPPTASEQTVTVTHEFDYATGTHYLTGDSSNPTVVELAPAVTGFAVTSPGLDLTQLGLDPLRNGDADNGAATGFLAGKFVVAPSASGSFKLVSEANNLQVEGTGFEQLAGGQGLSATVSPETAATYLVRFKIIDTTGDYALFVKHWKTTDVGCQLTLTFGSGASAQSITRHVDTLEGEGGDDNLTVVSLRNKEYTSINYHDYLVMGMNIITITVAPDAASGTAGYVLRALAIGES